MLGVVEVAGANDGLELLLGGLLLGVSKVSELLESKVTSRV